MEVLIFNISDTPVLPLLSVTFIITECAPSSKGPVANPWELPVAVFTNEPPSTDISVLVITAGGTGAGVKDMVIESFTVLSAAGAVMDTDGEFFTVYEVTLVVVLLPFVSVTLILLTLFLHPGLVIQSQEVCRREILFI